LAVTERRAAERIMAGPDTLPARMKLRVFIISFLECQIAEPMIAHGGEKVGA
jgi:hypothetical protein